jgi:hypothetical protein
MCCIDSGAVVHAHLLLVQHLHCGGNLPEDSNALHHQHFHTNAFRLSHVKLEADL